MKLLFKAGDTNWQDLVAFGKEYNLQWTHRSGGGRVTHWIFQNADESLFLVLKLKFPTVEYIGTEENESIEVPKKT